MSPHREARAHAITGNDLVVTALLLRVKEIALDCER
jgi:hypothetical protein